MDKKRVTKTKTLLETTFARKKVVQKLFLLAVRHLGAESNVWNNGCTHGTVGRSPTSKKFETGI